ncbi:phosphotransferase, partial [Vibrio parahaemolyticus]|nr:phosphotransferase [Vibrio parahaemolyticus]
MMSNNHQRYQTIGQELNLGNYRSVEVIQSLWGGYGELVRVT